MAEKTIAVRLHPQLEKEGRGLCDPEDPRNNEIITPLNYSTKGYLRVHASGFIQAQIQAGTLIRVPESKSPAADAASKGAAVSKRSRSSKASRGSQR